MPSGPMKCNDELNYKSLDVSMTYFTCTIRFIIKITSKQYCAFRLSTLSLQATYCTHFIEVVTLPSNIVQRRSSAHAHFIGASILDVASR